MTSIKFICPCCAAEHERGYIDGFSLFRCLRCGYSGHGFHPDTEIDRKLFESHTTANRRNSALGIAEEKPFENWEPGRSVIRHSLGIQ